MNEYAFTHLICDGNQPLITNASLEEEAMLYNLKPEVLHKVITLFKQITDKEITPETDISQLSGGQKVVLMILLAIHSKADKILMLNAKSALDPERSDAVQTLIKQFQTSKQEILQLDL